MQRTTGERLMGEFAAAADILKVGEECLLVSEYYRPVSCDANANITAQLP